MKIPRAIGATLLSLLCSTAAGNPSFEPRMGLLQSCLDGEVSPTGMAICAAEGSRQAERRLRELLRQAARSPARLRKADLDPAQSHWLRHREHQCNLYQPTEGVAGSQTPAEIESCRFALTLRREAELRRPLHHGNRS